MSGEDKQLYVMPDDRWEVNNVYSRCTAIGDELEDVLNQAIKSLAETGPSFQIELSEDLCVGLD